MARERKKTGRARDRLGRLQTSDSGASIWPWLLGGVVFSCLFGSVFWFSPTQLDDRFCPVDRKTGVTALLIDASDKLSNDQKAGLRAELKNIANVGGSRPNALLKKGDRLVVYFLNEDGETPSKIFDMCNPGKIETRTAVEKATEGELFAKKRWYQFGVKIMSEVDKRIAKITPNLTSPIIETTKVIVSTEFPPADLIEDRDNYRIIIASDFLQNSPVGSHYRNIPDPRIVWKRKPIDFGGAGVFMWRLNSSSHLNLQSASHTKWWREFFAVSKGRLQGVKQF